jgi:cytochrome c biogenesis protein CcmG/thiol:disulfide interchange protein DsbE
MRNAAKSFLACVGLLAPVAAATAGDPASLVGRPAPEIEATAWVHGDGRAALADFRGEVVLLEFWKTHCGASRGEVRHLARLVDELGKKGLEVIALTSDDDRRTVTRFLTHFDASPNYRIAVGAAGGYAMTRLPCAVLVGPDGKVLLDGTGGRSFSDKDVEAALKTVRPPTADEIEARAAKRLAFAESFAKDRLFARAEYEMRETAKQCAGAPSAKKASERAKALAEGESAAELEAQRDVAKLIGLGPTLEHPVERLRPAEVEPLAKRLLKKADDLRAKTPRAAKLAEEWAEILADPWK